MIEQQRQFKLTILRSNGDLHLILTDCALRAQQFLKVLKEKPEDWEELKLEGPKGEMEKMP